METHRKPNVNPLRQVSSEFLAKKSISGISSPLSISTFKRYYRTIWFKKYNSLSLFTAIAKQPQQVSGGFPLGLQIRQHCLYKSLSQMDGVCPSPILKILIQKEPSFYLLLIFLQVAFSQKVLMDLSFPQTNNYFIFLNLKI